MSSTMRSKARFASLSRPLCPEAATGRLGAEPARDDGERGGERMLVFDDEDIHARMEPQAAAGAIFVFAACKPC